MKGQKARRSASRSFVSLLLMLCCISLFLPLSHAEPSSSVPVYVVYRVTEETPLRHYAVDFDDSAFPEDAGVYSHDLCRMSLGMALASFRPADPEGDQDVNIRAFFEQAGFEDLRTDQYGQTTGENTIGTAIASKRITCGEKPFTLVAVAVCGGGYRDEWLSNFKVGNPGDRTAIKHHQGFYEAALKVEARLEEYIGGLDGDVRVWFAGFSRGAAVANLSAALSVQHGLADSGDVFAYTFATPANTRDLSAGSDAYRGFYSITGMFDIVPKVPLSKWGFTRYGRTLTLPSLESDGDYALFFDRATAWSKENLGDPFFRSGFVNYSLEKILDSLAIIFPTAADYVEIMQQRAMDLWKDKGNMLEMIRLLSQISGEMAASAVNTSYLETILAEDAWQGLVQWSGSGGDMDVSASHSLVENLAREHFPDAYASLIMSSGEELYDEHRSYARVVLWGHADMTVTDVTGLDEDRVKDLTPASVTGLSTAGISGKKDRAGTEQPWPLLQFSGGSVLTLPGNREYLLFLETEDIGGETLVIREYHEGGTISAEKSLFLNNPENTDRSFTARLDMTADADPYEDIPLHAAGGTVYARSTDPGIDMGVTDLVFIVDQSPVDNLRLVAVILGVIVLALTVTLVLAAVWAVRGRDRRAAVVLTVLLGILYILIQLSSDFLPAWGGFRAAFKGLATGTVLLLCLLCALQNKSRRNLLMLLGFLCYIANDVLIDIHLLSGLIASAIGNAFFIAAFCIDMKRSRAQWIAGAAALIVAAAVLILFREEENVRAYFPELCVCALLLACLEAAAFGQSRPFRIGSVLLGLTAVSVFYTVIRGSSWLTYLISLALYYSGMVFLALGSLDGKKLPVLSARGEKRLAARSAKKSAGG